MMKLGSRCILQKISAKFECGGLGPWVRIPKNVTLGYDIGKISIGCLVTVDYSCLLYILK